VLIAQRIVADITSSGKGPGDRLPPEREMLDEYGVGRGTLRESLRFLELQGLITLKPGPGGGPIVQQPDGMSLATSLTLLLQSGRAPYSTIVEARLGLEPIMASLSAQRMDREALARLQESVDMMGSHLADQDAFLEANKQFHEIIAHGSGNLLFGHLVDAVIGILDGSSIGVDYPEVRRKAVHKAHATICDAIVAGKPDDAAQAMQHHVEEYGRYIARKFPDVLSSPITWNFS